MPDPPVRVHASHLPLGPLLHRMQPAQPTREPAGLWWADGDAWLRLFEHGRRPAGYLKPGSGRHIYHLHLAQDRRLLRLDSLPELLAFSERYGRNVPHQPLFFWQQGDQTRYDHLQRRAEALIDVASVQWNEVARQYDGIEITPAALDPGARPRIPWLDIDWVAPGGCLWRPGTSTAHLHPRLEAAKLASRNSPT